MWPDSTPGRNQLISGFQLALLWATGPTPPAPSTGTLLGRVTQSGASPAFPIAGAVLTIGDGANAGKTATTTQR